MKARHRSVFIAGAIVALRAHSAAAQVLITPADIQAMGPHIIYDYSVSPSDESLAFTVAFPDSTTGDIATANLWTAPHTGATSQQITTFTGLSASAAAPAWNTFGNVAYLVHHVIPGPNGVPGPELAVTNVSATPSAALHVAGFSWSDTQDSLVFAAQDDTTQDNAIYTVNMNGSMPPVKIVACGQGADQCAPPQWSPTEDVIAYDRGGDIHLVNIDGSNDHVVIPNGTSPVWSPITGLLAFQCDNDVCVASEDGAGLVNITKGQAGRVYSQPAWNADESLIAVIGRSSSTDATGDLYVVSAGGQNLQALTTNASANAPQWSPVLPSTTDPDNPITSAPAFELFFICTSAAGPDLCILTGLKTPPAGCSPTTCAGCCSGGVCLNAESPGACGVGGAACLTCPNGQNCTSGGQCANPDLCGIWNCPNGCCDSNNTCHDPPWNVYCGLGGTACARCSANQLCKTATGVCETQACGTATCNGCCRADGTCDKGTSNSSCGFGGIKCADCGGNATCTVARICENQGCTISNCASGCCRSGTCQPGTSSNACGAGGMACFDCGSQACDKNTRGCISPQTCLGGNCQGCCDANNVCQAGNTPASCGGTGFICTGCSSGEECLDGFCEFE